MERCGNCSIYPFCEKTKGASMEKCEEYIKSHLENVGIKE